MSKGWSTENSRARTKAFEGCFRPDQGTDRYHRRNQSVLRGCQMHPGAAVSEKNYFVLACRAAAKYWHRPLIWPAIWSVAVRYVYRSCFRAAALEEDRRSRRECEIAREWCLENAVGIEQLHQSHRLPFEFLPVDVETKFVDIFRSAHERVQACPVKLGGAGNLDLLYSLARSSKAQRIIETGVAYGWSSLVLLLATKDFSGGRVYSVDRPYLNLRNDDWVGIAVPQSLRPHWRLFRTTDRVGLPWVLRRAKSVDMAHYDSDKTPEGRTFGYNSVWRRLRPGGILVSDDVGDNLAFKCFAEQVGRTPIVVAWNDKYQGILIR